MAWHATRAHFFQLYVMMGFSERNRADTLVADSFQTLHKWSEKNNIKKTKAITAAEVPS